MDTNERTGSDPHLTWTCLKICAESVN
jgi:hypothetical protein